MQLIDLLSEIRDILKKEPAVVADPSIKKQAAALEKSLMKMRDAIRPFADISFNDYLELKSALKGNTSKAKLPGTSLAFEKNGINLRSDANGKISYDQYVLEACRKKTALKIVEELKKKPEDIYKEDLFHMARQSDDSAKKYIEKKYTDGELKKFMKAVSVTPGKKSGKYDRQASIQNILYKLTEARARI